ncbi:MAG: hypothetical protein LH628_05140 [Microcoleus sp. CAN_BIN18]|nr:hypothetical protein [Microcoleus sp. CAN_BIN18]
MATGSPIALLASCNTREAKLSRRESPFISFSHRRAIAFSVVVSHQMRSPRSLCPEGESIVTKRISNLLILKHL